MVSSWRCYMEVTQYLPKEHPKGLMGCSISSCNSLLLLMQDSPVL